MLRLAALITLALATGPATADPIEQGLATAGKATDRILADNGTIGAVLILVALASVVLHALQGYAIASLYKANQALQEKRAAEAAEATKQVASTSISGANAITASAEKMAGIDARLLALADRISPLNGDHQRIIANQEKILDGQNDLARSCGRGAA